METQLPVALLQHLESIGCLPRDHGDDGIDNLDRPNPRIFEFNMPKLDENGEPDF